MMTCTTPLLRRVVQLASATLVCLLGSSLHAQTPQARILQPIDEASRVTLAGSRSPHAVPAHDAGQVPADTALHGITLYFRRSDVQQADLDTLIAAQQDPASPLYHQWLTPDQFAARFGMADSDLAKVEAWLQSQGFAVESVSRSRDQIHFSGTEAQVASAFGTTLHYYKENGVQHFAPSSDLSIPAALSPVVLGVRNLSSFRPAPQMRPSPLSLQGSPQFTSGQTGSHFLTPKDIATIYDVTPAYSAGYNGAGQTIAVAGQSSIFPSDITRFQSLAGVAVRAPAQVLVPNTGNAAISLGDEAESDLDLEYTSSMAPGANIVFVYTGSNTNYGAFDAMEYAITERIAPVISLSYAECEYALGATNYAALNSLLSQAAAQGQTIVSAAGDQGSEGCSGDTFLTAAQQQVVSTVFPASSQYVTGLGGTEFPSAYVATTATTYWAPSNGSDVVSTALSYIPEQVWNDNTANGTELQAGGGGISAFTPRPSWQAGVPGIPSGTYRLVPDVSLTSSGVNAPYLYCSSDPTSGVTGSCSNGFRDSNSQYLTTAGGTSFAAPVFAGLVAVLNQARNSTGQGVINPTLYSLASNPSTYANAFHDTTTGNNACLGAGLCSTSGASLYSAGTGYDEASGLGSIDFAHLLAVWPASSTSSLLGSAVSLSAATLIPAVSAQDTISITVSSTASNTTVPTGTVLITVDGATTGSTVTLVNGSAAFSFSSTSAGSHTINVSYSGDAVYAPSVGSLSVTVGGTAQSFLVTANSFTISRLTGGSTTITVTPFGGYAGTVNWTVTPTGTISNACYTLASLPVSGSAASTSFVITASSTTCANALRVKGGTLQARTAPPRAPVNPLRLPAEATFAGLLAVGLLGRRSRRLGSVLMLSLVAVLGLGLTGCGENSVNSTSTTPTGPQITTGTFPITITGTDSANSALKATITIDLTIQ